MARLARAGGWLRQRLSALRRLCGGRRLRAAWTGACVLGLAAVLSSGAGGQYRLKPGQVAPVDLVAPREFVDRPATERLRQEAASRVMATYVRRAEAAQRAEEAAAGAFDLLRQARAELEQGGEREGAVGRLRQRLPFPVRDAALEEALSLSADDLERAERDVRDILRWEMSRNITVADLPTFQREAVAAVRSLGHAPLLSDFLAAVVEHSLQPNFFLDREETERQRRAAMAAVRPVTIVRGEMIVRRGQKLTEEDVARLADAGLLAAGSRWPERGASLLWALLLAGFLGGLVRVAGLRSLDHDGRFLALGVICVGGAALGRVLSPLSPLLTPAAGCALLTATLANPVLALGVGATVSVANSLTAGGNTVTLLVGLAEAAAAVITGARLSSRADLMRAGLWSAAGGVAVLAAYHLLPGGVSVPALGVQAAIAAAAGLLLGGVLAVGSLPFFENGFGILTALRLLELANPNQPLLRKLMLTAPGTYHHSIVVANLAEAAAEAIGADALLARVGAYYHDVGKIKRPYFFVENQMNGQNPHDRLSPHLSALIVTSHVKDGIELARHHRLPAEIARFIPEHHGTSLLTYFYRRALEEGGAGEVTEEMFRHHGPRPQTRETVVVMLADAAEAACRALRDPSPGRLQATVRRVIRERLADGQLDQCDLTLRDLDLIAEAFVRVLGGMYHERVQYPSLPGADRSRAGPRGGDAQGRAGPQRAAAGSGVI